MGDAAFYEHMHRAVDHKTVKRTERIDTIPFTFAQPDGVKKVVQWTAKEFDRLEFDAGRETSWILDDEARKRISGRFVLEAIGDHTVQGEPMEKVRSIIAEKTKAIASKRPGQQVEIFVAHQNIIRYMFLKSMQFD